MLVSNRTEVSGMPHPLQARRDEQERLHRAMLQSREEWEKASAELQRVLVDHREDVITSGGAQALQNARKTHRFALDKYKAALMQFADGVLGRGPEADS
jgi:hypothetical protein